jgi:hypothetical protein
MGHTLHHQGLNLDEELLRPQRSRAAEQDVAEEPGEL